MENNQLLKLMGLIEAQKRLMGLQVVVVKELTERVLRLEQKIISLDLRNHDNI